MSASASLAGDGNDLTFQSTLVQYLLDSQLSGFMWSLNGNDGHTGGLLDSKWKELRTQKVDLLMRLPRLQPLLQLQDQNSSRSGMVPSRVVRLTRNARSLLLRAGIRR